MSGPNSIKGYNYQLDATLLLIFESIANKDFLTAHIEVRRFNKTTNVDEYDVDLILESPKKNIRIIEMKSGKYSIQDIKSVFDKATKFWQEKGYKQENISCHLVIQHRGIKEKSYPCKVTFLGGWINDSFFESYKKSHIQMEIIDIFCNLFTKLDLPSDYSLAFKLYKNYSFILKTKIDKFAQDYKLKNKGVIENFEQKIPFNLNEILTARDGLCDILYKKFNKIFSSTDDVLNKLEPVITDKTVLSIDSITKESNE